MSTVRLKHGDRRRGRPDRGLRAPDDLAGVQDAVEFLGERREDGEREEHSEPP